MRSEPGWVVLLAFPRRGLESRVLLQLQLGPHGEVTLGFRFRQDLRHCLSSVLTSPCAETHGSLHPRHGNFFSISQIAGECWRSASSCACRATGRPLTHAGVGRVRGEQMSPTLGQLLCLSHLVTTCMLVRALPPKLVIRRLLVVTSLHLCSSAIWLQTLIVRNSSFPLWGIQLPYRQYPSRSHFRCSS
jgi:hypothetical protein